MRLRIKTIGKVNQLQLFTDRKSDTKYPQPNLIQFSVSIARNN